MESSVSLVQQMAVCTHRAHWISSHWKSHWGTSRAAFFPLCWVHTKRFVKSYKIFKMWETTNMSGKNPTVCDVLGVPPHTWGFLIVNIQHVEYLRFAIRAPPTFFRADSATLNTPHTTWKSDKMIFRTTKIIGTLPKIVGRGESAQNQPDYLVVCTQH